MNKIKQNSAWLYGVLLIVLMLPLFFRWQNGPLYLGKILLIQILALWGSYLMFRILYQNQLAVLLGVTLYVTSLWRMDLCFVQNKLMLSLVWALVPLYLYCILALCKTGDDRINICSMPHRKEKVGSKCSRWCHIILASAVLAAIGYGSDVMFCLIAALTLLIAMCMKHAELLLPVAGGGLLWIPGNVDFLRYLFTDYADYGVPVQHITSKGYTFLDFLTTYNYIDGKPGLGIGLLIAMAMYFYVRFVREKTQVNKECRILGTLGLLSLLLATRYFPWELVQRLGGWALKFVSQLDTPALFIGFASLFLPAMAVSAVDALEQEAERIPAMGSLVISWIFAVGIAVYFCL